MSDVPQARIRNFCIVAHIDHGKSTLADRFLQITNTISDRDFEDQVLDGMDLERERGITIKAKAVTMSYRAADGELYQLQLIDTPGHVDFSYEVSRSLAACEGAVLVVDSTQGVEAQTVANTHLAIGHGLEIVPAINKIDMPATHPDEVEEEMTTTFGFRQGEALRCSAKTGVGVREILEAVVARIPAPSGDPAAALRALVFDSHYDEYLGVIIYVRIVDGTVRRNDDIVFMSTGQRHQVSELGRFTPGMVPRNQLSAGEVGYITAQIKSVRDVKIGDTVTHRTRPASEPLPGFQVPQPVVFCGLYPSDTREYDALRGALDKLRLNDSSFTCAPESSDALGLGFRCGFLGLLHMEIVQERIERESGIEVVQTAPTVTYQVLQRSGAVVSIDSPADLPDLGTIEEIREPIVQLRILLPSGCVGTLMKLLEERRGRFLHSDYLSMARVQLTYEVPLAEIILDFHDKLKSATRGYGTMNYQPVGFRADDLVKLDILVHGTPVDALGIMVHRSVAERRGRALLKKLKEAIPKHLFQIPLQAAIGTRVVARETIAALSKNVIAKCYGGDITRKRKLLEKQKEGKRRMRQVGRVEIPQEAFLSVLRLGDEESR